MSQWERRSDPAVPSISLPIPRAAERRLEMQSSEVSGIRKALLHSLSALLTSVRLIMYLCFTRPAQRPSLITTWGSFTVCDKASDMGLEKRSTDVAIEFTIKAAY